MRRNHTITGIALAALLLIGGAAAHGQATPAEPEPLTQEQLAAHASTMEQKGATEDRLRLLLQLKQRADKARRKQAAAEWAADGQRKKAKAEWAKEGRAQMAWTSKVEFWGQEDTAMLRWANAHRVSPLGLLIRDLEAAVEAGDQAEIERLLPLARKVYARAANQ